MQPIRTMVAAGALCAPLFALAMPACAQPYSSQPYGYASGYTDNQTATRAAYDQGYRDAAREYDADARAYDRALADFYNPRPVYDAPETVIVSSERHYGETTAQAHPWHGKYNFSMDGTSHVGGFTEVGPHTTWGMAVGKAAGGSTGGYYSTGP